MEERVYQGWLYRRSGPGQPWARVGPAQAPQSGVRVDPSRAADVQRAEAQADIASAQAPYAGSQAAADARAAAARASLVEAQAPYAGQTAASDAARAAAEAETARLKAQAAQAEQANAPDPALANIARQLQTDNVLGVINTARAQIGRGGSTGNLFGTETFQGVPFAGQRSANLAATLSSLQGSVINDTLERLRAQSSTGASGYGALSEREAQRLAASVGALQQTQDEKSLLNSLARVERHYRNALALLNNEDPRLEATQEKYGIIPEGAPAAPSPPSGNGLTSEGRAENDPGLAGTNSVVQRMVSQGRNEADIRGYLNRVRPGLGDSAQNINEVIQYHNQRPDAPINVDVERFWTPATGASQTLGDIGMSPLGAGVIGAADIATMGTLDNLTANPDLSRAVMAGVAEENPTSYFLGQVAGGVGSGLGLEGALARGGLTGLARLRAGDALFGAGYGAGAADEPDDSRVLSALTGAGAGLAGGAIGRTATRGAGRLASGIQEANRGYLNEAGVPMTIGQLLGGTAQRTEDRFAGFPFVGDQIRQRRMEGLEAFNRAAFDEGLAPVGGTTGGVIAESGVDIARQLRSDAYSNALDPVRVTADPQFVADMQEAITAGAALPEPMLTGIQYTLPTRVGEAFDAAGNLTGRDYQQALRGLRRDANAVANQPYGYDFGGVTRQAEGALEGLLNRQAPGVVEALANANTVNRNVETLRDAVNRARNASRSGTVGVFAPSQLSDAAAQAARRYGNTQGTTRQPFFELTRAAQSVLPSSVPDSGTAGRIALPAIIGALAGGGGYVASEGEGAQRAGTGLGTGLTVAALAAAPYSAGARNAVQRALMAERPEALTRVGDLLLNRAELASLFSAPALVTYQAGQ